MTDHPEFHTTSDPLHPALTPLPESRSDLAKFVLDNREQVRRRVLGKLRHTGQKSLDPDDILSSALRRLDSAFVRGLVHAQSPEQLWAFVVAVIDNVTLNKLRSERVRRAPLPARALDPRWLADRFADCADNDQAAHLLHRVLMTVRSESDRELIFWKLGGASYAAIAAATGRTEVALRAQWSRICRQLRADLDAGAPSANHPGAAGSVSPVPAPLP